VKKRKERIDRGIKVRSEDIFVLCSWREMLYLSGPRVFPALLILIIPLFLSPYWEKVMISVCVFALLAISWDLLAQSGMLSLGQALFFGLGAYISGVMNYYWHLPIFITIPAATILGAAMSTLMLLPALRLRGIYFAMITLMLPVLLGRIIEATAIFGGTEGLYGLSPIYYKYIEIYAINIIMLVAFFSFRRLLDLDYGLVLRAVRDNDRAVQSAGLNIYSYKTQALLFSSAIGAFAGAYMTHIYMFVGIPVFNWDYSILPIACTVLGGSGTLAGALLGAFILVPLSEFLRSMGSLRVVFYGVLLVSMIVLLPEGIFHYIKRKYYQFERLVEVDK
jgi:branched-chain amino acid transport system permease protein